MSVFTLCCQFFLVNYEWDNVYDCYKMLLLSCNEVHLVNWYHECVMCLIIIGVRYTD